MLFLGTPRKKDQLNCRLLPRLLESESSYLLKSQGGPAEDYGKLPSKRLTYDEGVA